MRCSLQSIDTLDIKNRLKLNLRTQIGPCSLGLPRENHIKRGEEEVYTNVAYLENLLRESHELAITKLRTSQKLMKRDHDLHIR